MCIIRMVLLLGTSVLRLVPGAWLLQVLEAGLLRSLCTAQPTRALNNAKLQKIPIPYQKLCEITNL